MKAFRIGRRPVGPWMNMTPPIRGGLLHDRLQEPAAVVDLGDTTATSLENQIAAVAADGDEGLHYRGVSRGLRLPDSEADLDAESVISSTLRSRASSGSGSPPPSSVTSVSDISDSLPPKCPAKFVDWAVEQGVDKCLEEYPSLDVGTQQAIRLRYRQLHQSIIDDGLYECRYTEYMKELARYSTLFVLFLGFLSHGWYKTSAVFLGLFWVCCI
jgi:sphingolipid 8-(E)-desaturase